MQSIKVVITLGRKSVLGPPLTFTRIPPRAGTSLCFIPLVFLLTLNPAIVPLRFDLGF
jgi:hypothetical protein